MNIPGSTYHKELILDWFLYNLTYDQRQKLIAELPQAYNDVMQCEVGVVIHREDLPANIHSYRAA